MKWISKIFYLLLCLPLLLFGLLQRRKNEIKDDVNKLDGGIKLSILKSGFLNRDSDK